MCCNDKPAAPRIIGYTRIRNEALILRETLDHWGSVCDAIYVYDDASTDDTPAIAVSHPKVAHVFRNPKWQPGVHRNGQQRGVIYSLAVKGENAKPEDWFCCFDADERLVAPEGMRQFIAWCASRGYEGITCKLFDHYITPEDEGREYTGDLNALREWVGPEYREQLFFFKYRPSVGYHNSVAREPNRVCNLISSGTIRHYGKAISVEHWEDTCGYYATYFPEPFKTKWAARRGKAVKWDMLSDFGRPLVKWDKLGRGGKNAGPCLYAYSG